MVWWMMALTTASAQDVERFNGQVFRPSADSDLIWSDGSDAAPDGYATARLYTQYANGLVRENGPDPVANVVEFDLVGAWHWRGLRLGAHIPFYGFADGALENGQAGLGDVAVDIKAQVFDQERAPFGAALIGRLLLPTASVNVNLPLGNQGTGWEIIGVVDRDFGPLTVVANLGTRDVPRAVVGDIVWNDQVFGRLGAAYGFSERFGASLEVAAQSNWAPNVNPAGTAVEALGGVRVGLTDRLVLRGGVGAGLTNAPGAPAFRALLGIAWEPERLPDRDLDGITDREDDCPNEAEDMDGFEDSDGCLDAAVTTRVDVTAPDGTLLNALVVLDGVDSKVLGEGDSVVTIHPGVYQVVAEVDGYEPWAGEIEITKELGKRIPIEVSPRIGSLKVWAVDTDGQRIPAQVSIEDGSPMPANGEPIELQVGEYAMVVTASGYDAEAASIQIRNGQQRSLSVVMRRRQ